MTVAHPAPEHDVTDCSERGYLGHRLCGGGVQWITLRIPERMTAAHREHPDAGVHSVSRHDAEHVGASPHLAQHLAGSAFLGAENPHLATGLANC